MSYTVLENFIRQALENYQALKANDPAMALMEEPKAGAPESARVAYQNAMHKRFNAVLPVVIKYTLETAENVLGTQLGFHVEEYLNHNMLAAWRAVQKYRMSGITLSSYVLFTLRSDKVFQSRMDALNGVLKISDTNARQLRQLGEAKSQARMRGLGDTPREVRMVVLEYYLGMEDRLPVAFEDYQRMLSLKNPKNAEKRLLDQVRREAEMAGVQREALDLWTNHLVGACATAGIKAARTWTEDHILQLEELQDLLSNVQRLDVMLFDGKSQASERISAEGWADQYDALMEEVHDKSSYLGKNVDSDSAEELQDVVDLIRDLGLYETLLLEPSFTLRELLMAHESGDLQEGHPYLQVLTLEQVTSLVERIKTTSIFSHEKVGFVTH